LKLPKSIGSILLFVSSAALLPGAGLAQVNYGSSTTPGSINPLNPNAVTQQQGQNSQMPMPSAMPGANSNQVLGDQPKELGWDGLAKVLDAISPSVDTRVPLTPSEVATRIEGLIRADRLPEALAEVEKRLVVEANRATPGTDVQLMFMQARLFTEMNRLTEAEAIYQRMTMRFPELPEPWNNLAALYVRRDELDQARRALEQAIMINPKYAVAQANLGDVQMSLALRAYQRAAAAGVPGLTPKIRSVKTLIEGSAK
jgi:tetratricopeptide (TPR) repeat protein